MSGSWRRERTREGTKGEGTGECGFLGKWENGSRRRRWGEGEIREGKMRSCRERERSRATLNEVLKRDGWSV